MACPACRTPNPGWGRYCNSCGADQGEQGLTCAECGIGNTPGARFCSGCGVKVALALCLQCGTWNPLGRSNCLHCQTALPRAEEATGDAGGGIRLSPPAHAARRWKLDRVLLIRVAPEGVGELARAAPIEAARYHQAFQTLLQHAGRDHAGIPQELEDGGGLVRLPVNEGDLERVVLAAVEVVRQIQAGLRQLEEQRRREGAGPMSVRIALHFGDVVADEGQRSVGVMSGLAGEGTDLIRLCPAGEVCISAGVQEALGRSYLSRPVGLIGRRGGRRGPAYLLGPVRPRLPGSELGWDESSPLVGREREVSHLKRRWNEVARGGGSRLFTLISAPGMGRGRMVESLLHQLREQGAAHVLASCDESASLAPFAPIIDLLYQLLDVSPEDDERTLGLRLTVAAQRAVAAEGWTLEDDDPEVVELAVMVGEMLGIEVDSRGLFFDPAGLDPESLRQRMFYAVLRLLRGLSQEAPRALVIEDVHLADGATLDLIQYLGGTLRGSGRLLLLCTAVPALLESRPGWGRGWWRHETLTLGPVAGEALGALVKTRLGGHGTRALVHLISQRAQGRPGVAELLATALVAELEGGAGASGGQLDEMARETLAASGRGQEARSVAPDDERTEDLEVGGEGTDLTLEEGTEEHATQGGEASRAVGPESAGGEASRAGGPESAGGEASRAVGEESAGGEASRAVGEESAGGEVSRAVGEESAGGEASRALGPESAGAGKRAIDAGPEEGVKGEGEELPEGHSAERAGKREVSERRLELPFVQGHTEGDGESGEDEWGEEGIQFEEGSREEGDGVEATVIVPLRQVRTVGGQLIEASFSALTSTEPLENVSLGELEQLLPGQVWARRLGALEPPARQLLGFASVVGRTFRGEVLSALWTTSGESVEGLEGLLRQLVAEGFLRRRVESSSWQVSWRFRGTLAHRVAYDSVARADRYLLHRRLARLLEGDRTGARVRASYGLVAYHHDQGEDADRAMRYYAMAGKAAQRVLALPEGERLFARALNLLKESGFPDGGNENVALHRMHGQILGLLNEPKRAVAELETALEFARLRQDRRQECEVLMSICEVLEREGEHEGILGLALRARDSARAAHNSRLLVRSLRQIGWEHLRGGRAEEGRDALEEAVRVAMESNNAVVLTEAMESLGAFYYLRGNFGLAVRGYEDLMGHLKRALRPRPAPGT